MWSAHLGLANQTRLSEFPGWITGMVNRLLAVFWKNIEAKDVLNLHNLLNKETYYIVGNR